VRADGLVPLRAGLADSLSADLRPARRRREPRPSASVVGDERPVPGFSLRDPVRSAARRLHLARRLLQRRGAGEVAPALQPEPGRGDHRRLPMVPSERGGGALLAGPGRQPRHGGGLPVRGRLVLPQDRTQLRGPSVMVADVVIQADGLGKRYVLGHQGAGGGYVALRDVIAHGAADFSRAVVHRMRGGRRQTEARKEEFWALHDVGFEVHRGEVIGIIGRNGAGKSTLLKVLSRITEPSAGRVRIRGRVASLLEVGTGFHAELTGRENIFLNGAILGMSGNEIRRKFDEIVAFADVEKFLDTPVKRYSSGMYVRLAFAVAAHLEPEILVVDEVLAVGDLEFQNKCLGKMSEVAGLGRTVLFVSHNMAAIRTLCSRGLLFTSGTITRDDAVASVIAEYL